MAQEIPTRLRLFLDVPPGQLDRHTVEQLASMCAAAARRRLQEIHRQRRCAETIARKKLFEAQCTERAHLIEAMRSSGEAV